MLIWWIGFLFTVGFSGIIEDKDFRIGEKLGFICFIAAIWPILLGGLIYDRIKKSEQREVSQGGKS